jgi:hypothetical protein
MKKQGDESLELDQSYTEEPPFNLLQDEQGKGRFSQKNPLNNFVPNILLSQNNSVRPETALEK